MTNFYFPVSIKYPDNATAKTYPVHFFLNNTFIKVELKKTCKRQGH